MTWDSAWAKSFGWRRTPSGSFWEQRQGGVGRGVLLVADSMVAGGGRGREGWGQEEGLGIDQTTQATSSKQRNFSWAGHESQPMKYPVDHYSQISTIQHRESSLRLGWAEHTGDSGGASRRGNSALLDSA